MVNEITDRSQLQEKLAELQRRLTDLKTRWPAHSLKPSMIMELEGLEEEIEDIEEKLRKIEEAPERL